MTVLAYGPAYSAGFIWDDDVHVTKNPTLTSVEGLSRIWSVRGGPPQFYPLVFTSFWIEYQFWGLRPTGYHVVNVLLHAGAAVMLWRLLRRASVPGAWLAAAVFALHPVHAESVAWVTERKNVLSGAFYMAAALAYLRWEGSFGCSGAKLRCPSEAPRGPAWWYAAASILFVCALLSKTVTCTLPAAIALLIWWKHGRLVWRDVTPLLPLLVLGAALGLNTAWMERHVVGAEGSDWRMTLAERCLVAGRAIWFYLGKLVWPANLAFNYPRWAIDSTQAWQYAYPLAAIALPIALWLWRGRLGRGPLAAVLFFGGTLVPALGFADLYPMRYSFVADHFQYLASIGMIVLIVALLAKLFGSLKDPRSHATAAAPAEGRLGRVTACLIAALLLLCCGTLTWRQSRAYADSESIWRDALAKSPDAALARLSLAKIFQARGELDEAIEQLATVVRMDPKVQPPTVRLGAYINLGISYNRKGEPGAAAEHFRNALRIQPDYSEAHHGLGLSYEALGRLDEAIAEYQLAVKADPKYTPARRCLEAALNKRGGQSSSPGQSREPRLP